jgi:hypothetical protein
MSDETNEHVFFAVFSPRIPVEPDTNEPWRKNHLSCSGSGRISRNFDLRYIESLGLYRDDS